MTVIEAYMDHLVVALVYEGVQDAATRHRLRACDHLLREELLPLRGTLLDGRLLRQAASFFSVWTAYVRTRRERRMRVRVVNVWSNLRRNLHNDDTPILPFGEV